MNFDLQRKRKSKDTVSNDVPPTKKCKPESVGCDLEAESEMHGELVPTEAQPYVEPEPEMPGVSPMVEVESLDPEPERLAKILLQSAEVQTDLQMGCISRTVAVQTEITMNNNVYTLKDILNNEESSIKNSLYDISNEKMYENISDLSEINPSNIFQKHTAIVKGFINFFVNLSCKSLENGNSKRINFTKVLIADLLVSLVYPKYVSAICFTTSVLNYCATGSKKSCQILSQCIPCGSYPFLQEWLSKLSKRKKEPTPDGVLAYALDNNQRLQRSWLSRNGNKQTLEIMTNILRVKIGESDEQFKETLSPLIRRQFKFLGPDFKLHFANNEDRLKCMLSTFNSLNSENRNASDKIKPKLISDALEEALIKCTNCQTFWPKKKIKCQNCKLNIRSQSTEALVNDTRISKKPMKNDKLKFYQYVPETQTAKGSQLSKVKINVTSSAKSTEKSLPVPEMTLIDPVFVNPASKAAVRVVLNEIAKDAGITSSEQGKRRWVFVVCDGSPMTILWRLIIEEPENFSWVVPITGLGHEEMNMVKTFNELFYDILLKGVFMSQGYLGPKSLSFAKSAGDHHIAFDNLMKFRDSLWSELIFQYKRNSKREPDNYSRFSQWIDESQDKTLEFVFKTVLPLLEAIFMFRDGVRTNNSKTIQLARSIFRPVWYGRHHTKYLLVDFFDASSRKIMSPEILNLIENHESISASGRNDAHQGLDFILEEFNKNVKKHISGIPNSEKWEKVIWNYDALCELRSNTCNLLSLKFDDSKPREVVDYSTERDDFRKVLRKSGFLIPKKQRKIKSLDPDIEITENAGSFFTNSIKIANDISATFNQSLSFPTKLNYSKLPLQFLKMKVSQKMKIEQTTNYGH